MIKNGIGWGRPSSASGSLEVVSPRRFGAHEELAGSAGVTSLAEDVRLIGANHGGRFRLGRSFL
jgi:hypothetical protein